MDEWDNYYGEEWLWLPSDEVAKLQREKNAYWRILLDTPLTKQPSPFDTLERK